MAPSYPSLRKFRSTRPPCFDESADRFQSLYLGDDSERLSAINRSFIESVCDLLEIDTRISDVAEFDLISTDPTDKLVDLCEATGSDVYLSGPAAKAYLDHRVPFGFHGNWRPGDASA